LTSDNKFLKGENQALEVAKKTNYELYLSTWSDYKDVLEDNHELRQENAELKKEINSWTKIENVKLTAYCPCTECSGKWGTLTKLGTTAKEGRTIAVDPNVIPLGSEVLIEGKIYIAEDIGGVVKGKVIDIYFDEHLDDFRKYVDVMFRR
jgi:3D (Asp-Asp-Asp) domain-containing protein